jgi:hypothetical protein
VTVYKFKVPVGKYIVLLLVSGGARPTNVLVMPRLSSKKMEHFLSLLLRGTYSYMYVGEILIKKEMENGEKEKEKGMDKERERNRKETISVLHFLVSCIVIILIVHSTCRQ